EGADVEFKIYNYAEFYTVAAYKSDGQGKASLDTGFGDIVVWAFKDGMFGIASIGSGNTEVVLDRKTGESYSFDLEIVPPAENPLPNNASEEETAANTARLAKEDAIRATMPHPRKYAPDLFLSEKDAIDITSEVIEDARTVSSDDPFVASPRVELEMLMPFRQEVISSETASQFKTPSDIAAWVKGNISVDDSRNPQGLRIPPVAVWRSHLADSRSRDIFFVALCRTFGFAARLDEASSRPEYRSGDGWVAVDFGSGTEKIVPQGNVKLIFPEQERTPQYYYQYTFSKITGGSPVLAEFDESAPAKTGYVLDEGYWMLTSGTRLADGSVLAHVETFTVASGSETTVPLVLRNPEDKIKVIGSIDAEALFLKDGDSEQSSILNSTGRGYFMVCITGERDEPTIHALGLLKDSADMINSWGRKVIVLDGAVPDGLDNIVIGKDVDGKIKKMILEGVEFKGSPRLPLIVIADSFGRVLFFSEGYNTSLASQIDHTLGQLK
ncbi:MAG: hypothetical protein Q4G10_00210, partial [Bacteroidia bacterium]|nr:hypothetical protein [Bacteroidia bacterium]